VIKIKRERWFFIVEEMCQRLKGLYKMITQGKSLTDVKELATVLMEDFEVISTEIKENSSQYNRRVFFMVSFSMVEAILNSIKLASLNLHEGLSLKIKRNSSKEELPKMCHTFRPRLTEEEVITLTEKAPYVDDNGCVKLRPMFLPFIKNLKLSFHLISKVLSSDFKPDYSDNNFEKLKESVKVRNRIVHPKNQSSLNISSIELVNMTLGIDWFIRSYHELIIQWGKLLNELIIEFDNSNFNT
jgi:hypothetical protein